MTKDTVEVSHLIGFFPEIGALLFVTSGAIAFYLGKDVAAPLACLSIGLLFIANAISAKVIWAQFDRENKTILVNKRHLWARITVSLYKATAIQKISYGTKSISVALNDGTSFSVPSEIQWNKEPTAERFAYALAKSFDFPTWNVEFVDDESGGGGG